VPFSNWWNTGPCVSVAEYSSTGTDTSPNVSTPDQIARAISLLPPVAEPADAEVLSLPGAAGFMRMIVIRMVRPV
jgi:hypothetical protein